MYVYVQQRRILCETQQSISKNRVQGKDYPIDVLLLNNRHLWDRRRFEQSTNRRKARGSSHNLVQLPLQSTNVPCAEVLLLGRLPEPRGVGNAPVSVTSPQRLTLPDKNFLRGGIRNQRKWVQRTPSPDVHKGPGHERHIVLAFKAKKDLAWPGDPQKGERIHLDIPWQCLRA